MSAPAPRYEVRVTWADGRVDAYRFAYMNDAVGAAARWAEAPDPNIAEVAAYDVYLGWRMAQHVKGAAS